MKTRILAAIVFAATMTAGCATTQWTKPGASQEDFVTASGECQGLAQQVRFQARSYEDAEHSGVVYRNRTAAGLEGLASGLRIAAEAQQAYAGCMNAHGWTGQRVRIQ